VSPGGLQARVSCPHAFAAHPRQHVCASANCVDALLSRALGTHPACWSWRCRGSRSSSPPTCTLTYVHSFVCHARVRAVRCCLCTWLSLSCLSGRQAAAAPFLRVRGVSAHGVSAVAPGCACCAVSFTVTAWQLATWGSRTQDDSTCMAVVGGSWRNSGRHTVCRPPCSSSSSCRVVCTAAGVL
jgi:hypothetical protein